MRLLVVASDPMEFPGILSHASEVRKVAARVDWCRAAKLGDHTVLLVANGAGAKRAAAAVDAVLEGFDAEAIVSAGFCGALDTEYRIGDIVVGSEIRANGLKFTAPKPSTGLPHHMGVVCSLDHVAQTSEEKRRLREGGSLAVEMEAAGVAERAEARGIKFYCIKVVTDRADEDMANDYNQALRPDGHFATISVLVRTLRDPLVRVPELIRLRNRCVRAARVLGDFIADCRF
jgi:nucleoside phosphorylase